MRSDVSYIIDAVGGFFHIPRREILSEIRLASVGRARATAMFLAHSLRCVGVCELGRIFDRDHATVGYLIKASVDWQSTEEEYAAQVKVLKSQIKSALFPYQEQPGRAGAD